MRKTEGKQESCKMQSLDKGRFSQSLAACGSAAIDNSPATTEGEQRAP